VIHIVQCLCPSRHCILASLYDPRDEAITLQLQNRRCDSTQILRETVEASIAAGAVNPWCGICKAKIGTWRYEDSPTYWRTMAEALKGAKAVEEAQRITREFLEAGRN
jgi:hypothetical protein